jgi:outer membrane protein assembly factor BamA
LANAEFRFPIYWLIHGAVFADAGNLWDDPDEVKLARFIDGLDEGKPSVINVRYGVGAGLRFMTPVGPFRLDYGARIGSGLGAGGRNGELHLSLGQAF